MYLNNEAVTRAPVQQIENCDTGDAPWKLYKHTFIYMVHKMNTAYANAYTYASDPTYATKLSNNSHTSVSRRTRSSVS